MKLLSTTQLSRELGVNLTADQVEKLTGIPPALVRGNGPSPTGIYWLEGQVQNIARALSEHFAKVAGDGPNTYGGAPLAVAPRGLLPDHDSLPDQQLKNALLYLLPFGSKGEKR